MSNDDQMTDDSLPIKRARNSPKHSQATWERVKIEFEDGSYKSLAELSRKYGINPITLRTRMVREQWNEKQRTLQNKIELKREEVKVDIGKEYLLSTFSRAKKYEKLIDSSLSQLATDASGNPVADSSDIDAYTRSEARIHALALSALRLPSTVQPIDVTSGGKSLGSIVDAIQRLRETNTAIDLTPEQVKLIGSMEVVD